VIFRVTDIETVPDLEVWTRGRPKYDVVPSVRRSTIAGGGVVEEEVLQGVEVDQLPPPYACRVVAISYVDVGHDPSRESRYYFDRCYSECAWSADGSRARADAAEYRLLSTFGAAMESTPDAHLVTWNGRTFDLPVIAMRSMGHKISCGWYYKNKDVRYRYSEVGHLDLMDFLSDYGACRFMKLGDVARLCGLPGKTDMSGDKVSVLHEEARRDPARSAELQARVARYCLQDSLQTALLFLRTRHHCGKVDAVTHDLALATFRDSPSVRDAIDLNWERLVL
jgi:hypothetical protein